MSELLEGSRALAWRVTKADPSGCMCWFDPDTEEPLIRRQDPPSDSDPWYPGGAMEGVMEPEEGGGGKSLEGGAADENDCSYLDVNEEPPPGFLSTLWEGGSHGEETIGP